MSPSGRVSTAPAVSRPQMVADREEFDVPSTTPHTSAVANPTTISANSGFSSPEKHQMTKEGTQARSEPATAAVSAGRALDRRATA